MNDIDSKYMESASQAVRGGVGLFWLASWSRCSLLISDTQELFVLCSKNDTAVLKGEETITFFLIVKERRILLSYLIFMQIRKLSSREVI